MDAPASAWEIVSYDLSAFIDEEFRGHLVFAGHVSFNSAAAVFTRLHELEIGDEIVYFKPDAKYTYKVFGQSAYPVKDFAVNKFLENYFGTLGQTMILITCFGEFDPVSHYLERLFIQASLQSVEVRQ